MIDPQLSQSGAGPDEGLGLSVVIPVLNERENIEPLYRSLCAALSPTGWRYELIFVDDGSRDGTLAELLAVQARDAKVRVIKFRTNFGQTAAMRAGIQLAHGPVIVTMDGDLQNDPRDIPTLVRRIHAGSDLVTGWRRDRKDPFFSRTLPSKLANWLIGKITGIAVHDNGCSLKAYRSEMIKRVPLYSEMHRFIPALSATAGASIAEVVVRHHARRAGRSKYGLSRIGKVLLDVVAVKMLIAFRDRPLRWFGALAMPFVVLSLVAAAGSVLLWQVRRPEQASIVLPAALLLCVYLTIHFLFTGLLAELIVAKGRRRSDEPIRTVRRYR